jgi:hypothetical protein
MTQDSLKFMRRAACECTEFVESLQTSKPKQFSHLKVIFGDRIEVIPPTFIKGEQPGAVSEGIS